MSFKNLLWRAGTGVFLLGCAATAVISHAKSPGPAPATSDIGAAARHVEHVQLRALNAAERLPLRVSRDHLRVDYDRPRMPAKRTQAACDSSVFATASGAALVTAVKAASVDCLNSLFSISGTQGAQVFPEAKMVTIANAMQADAGSYPGNDSAGMLQLVLYLRAGYYVQWYNPEVGSYGPTLGNAIAPALDAFVANAHFTDVNDEHGAVLAEFVTLIDSAGQNAHQLPALRGILDRYDASWQSYWYMKSAVNGVFSVLFRGHQNADFRAAVQVSPGSGVLDTLADFISRNKAADVGSDREYLLQNAAAELARFLNADTANQGYPPAFHASVHPKVKTVLDQFALTGAGSGIYVRMAGVIEHYDHADCDYFNLCTFAQDLEDAILPAANARDCSPTLRVRSQALTSEQLDWVCNRVGGEESYFHTQAQTGHVPVADDNNTRLEMVIFHSSSDYETYSGTLFGNDTNNGGIYLEGDPAAVGNQPRFLAYEAEWLRPTFDVWNLTHEYIHYLDGRFNWHGGFGDYPMAAPASAVWFIEGFAEFMSYSYRSLVYADAVGEAANPDKFTLAQLFDTEYSTDYARTYQWGYLAVRFMFERHRDDISALFAVTRPGNYSPGYTNWLDPIRSAYNAEFRAWVVCFAAGNGDTSACGGTASNDAIFANGFDGQAPVELPDCPQAADGRLDDGCKIGGLGAARSVDRVWLSILVPAGKTSLTLTLSGGSGDADLYEKSGNWPGDADYEHASEQVGNDETITIANPAAGWHYLMLKPKSSAFAAVQAAAHWQ